MNATEAALRGLVTTDEHGDLISPFYGYLPTKTICGLFMLLFTFTGVTHIVQTAWYRAYWLLFAVCLAASGEVVAWVARFWSSGSPLDNTPYMIQIVAAIISPTPLVAALFITFGGIVGKLGDQYSRLGAKWYTRIFLSCDVIALIVQAAGGGIAATTRDAKTGRLGSNLMLAGIAFQLAALTVYSVLMAEYFIRLARKSAVRRKTDHINVTVHEDVVVDRNMKVLIGCLWASTVFLFVRSIYRTIELADGFTGIVIRTELYFNVFDAGMVFLALLALNIGNPARVLNKPPPKNVALDLFMEQKKLGFDSKSFVTVLSRDSR